MSEDFRFVIKDVKNNVFLTCSFSGELMFNAYEMPVGFSSIEIAMLYLQSYRSRFPDLNLQIFKKTTYNTISMDNRLIYNMSYA